MKRYVVFNLSVLYHMWNSVRNPHRAVPEKSFLKRVLDELPSNLYNNTVNVSLNFLQWKKSLSKDP